MDWSCGDIPAVPRNRREDGETVDGNIQSEMKENREAGGGR